jgi:hypothetical protein
LARDSDVLDWCSFAIGARPVFEYSRDAQRGIVRAWPASRRRCNEPIDRCSLGIDLAAFSYLFIVGRIERVEFNARSALPSSR